jgi:pimeloyl-ACP methyl ester carboxylesterase
MMVTAISHTGDAAGAGDSMPYSTNGGVRTYYEVAGQGPTLVTNGAYDNPLKGGMETAAGVPGAVHRVLPDAGHACNIEDPETFNGYVLEFFRDNGLLADRSAGPSAAEETN